MNIQQTWIPEITIKEYSSVIRVTVIDSSYGVGEEPCRIFFVTKSIKIEKAPIISIIFV